MSRMQNGRDVVRIERTQVGDVVRVRRGADDGQGRGRVPDAPPPAEAPLAPLPIPEGGGRIIIDRDGDRTTVTTAALPPELMPLVSMAQETALGLMGLLAAIIILGPFARMFARRLEKRAEMKAAGENTSMLQHQIVQLQQSVDAMSVEVERIGESQRFQSKLLVDRKSG